MARNVRCGLIQAHCECPPTKFSLPQIKEKMIAKHEKLVADAAKRKVQILGLQELFYGPYRDKDELLVADLDLDEIQQVRATWQFYRDRRPETYGEITRTLATGSAQAAD